MDNSQEEIKYYALNPRTIETWEDLKEIIVGIDLLLPSTSTRFELLSKYFTTERITKPEPMSEEELAFWQSMLNLGDEQNESEEN